MSLDIICSGCESFHEKYMYKLQIYNSSQCNSHFNNTAMTDTFYWNFCPFLKLLVWCVILHTQLQQTPVFHVASDCWISHQILPLLGSVPCYGVKQPGDLQHKNVQVGVTFIPTVNKHLRVLQPEPSRNLHTL